MTKFSILAVSAAVFALLGSSVGGAHAQDASLSGDQLKASSSIPEAAKVPASTPEPTVSYEEIWKSLGPNDPNDPNRSSNVTGRYLPAIGSFDSATRSSKNPNRMRGPRFLWSYSQGDPKPIEISYGDQRRDDIDGEVRTCMSEHPGNHISIRVWWDQAGYPKQIPQSQFEPWQMQMAGWVAGCVNKRLQSEGWARANHIGVLLCEYYTNGCWGDNTIWHQDRPTKPFFDIKPVAAAPIDTASIQPQGRQIAQQQGPTK